MAHEVLRETRRVPLPEAAAELGQTWAQTYNAVLSGKLVGEKVGTRWFVFLPAAIPKHEARPVPAA